MVLAKKIFAKIFAFFVVSKIKKSYPNAAQIQINTLKTLVNKAKKTKFGIEHQFHKINSVEEYIDKVPIRDYENIKKYIDEIKRALKTSCGLEYPNI